VTDPAGNVVMDSENGSFNGYNWTSPYFSANSIGVWNCSVTASGNDTNTETDETEFNAGNKGGAISTTEGATPFYTTSSNPQTCQNMKAGDSCIKTWTVNATGGTETTWFFYGISNATNYSAYISGNESDSTNITIIGGLGINILSPLSDTYNILQLGLNISLNPAGIAGSWCGYDLDNAGNVTMAADTNKNNWNATLSGLSEGTHSVTVTCNDSNALWWADATREFIIDVSAPNVTHYAPLNGSTWNNSMTVDFVYNVTDFGPIANCSLYLNGLFSQVDTTVTKGINQTFSLDLSDKNYTWHVNCTDVVNYTGRAWDWQVNVSVTILAPEIKNISIAPATAYGNSTLNCSAVYDDGNLDKGNVSIVWYNGSEQYGTATILNVPAGTMISNNTIAGVQAKNEEWNCTINATDRMNVAGMPNSTKITISNSAPQIANLQISPAIPSGTESLACAANVYDVDLDGMTVNFTWYNDTEYYNSSTYAAANGSYISHLLEPQGIQELNENWNCSVFANDGTADSALSSRNVAISGQVITGCTNITEPGRYILTQPITDWNGDGITEVGVYLPDYGRFYLDYNANGLWNGGVVDRSYTFAPKNGKPVLQFAPVEPEKPLGRFGFFQCDIDMTSFDDPIDGMEEYE